MLEMTIDPNGHLNCKKEGNIKLHCLIEISEEKW